jgi:hypothetical protein
VLSEIFFKSKTEINIFSDKQKLSKFVASRPALKEIFFKEKEKSVEQKL